MSEYIKIAQVAEILGVSEIDARVIVKFNGVQSKDGEQVPNAAGKIFGKPPKLYIASEVLEVLAKKIR